MSWIKVTRTLRGVKLRWVVGTLEADELRYRLNGETMDAPWIEVMEADQGRAKRLLIPVDSLGDNDTMFVANPGTANPAWWAEAPKAFGEFAGGLGILANKVLRLMAGQVKCQPSGASKYDCPYATGVIERCPADLWAACEPMSRTQAVFLGIAEALGGDDDESLRWADELINAARELREKQDEVYWLTFFHVIGEWLSEGTAHRLVAICGQGASAVVEAVLKDTKEIDGERFPRVISFNLSADRAILN